LPEKSGAFWDLVGPGAVLVGLSIGAGELIIWPTFTARYGAAMTWAAVLGVFLQLWINFEIARYTLATGESIFAAYIRLSRHWAWIFLLLTVIGWVLPGWARTCGGALKALLVGPHGPGTPWMWTFVTFTLVAAALFGPKLVYRSVERITEALVIVIIAGLVFIAFTVGDAGDWRELATGILSVPYKHPDMPAYELFSAIVFAGAGGTANLFYSFYIRDKGWGMGAHAGKIVNPLRSREERTMEAGYTPRLTKRNLDRWRDWIRHTERDQILFFWLLNTFTILLFIFGALAVLHARGIVPDQEMLVWDEAAMLGSVWGPFGTTLFLLIGVACLFSTQLTLVDGVARSIADIVHTAWPWARARSTSWWYAAAAWTWMVLGCVLTYFYERLPAFLFLLSAGFFGGIAMAVYCPLTLVANQRLLPEAIRPGPFRRIMLVAISVFYGAFAVVSIVVVSRRLLGI
jgi:Mn2+/Fe2+ NRAMP family transporter